MKTANEAILDRFIRHQTYLIRYAGGLRNESTDLLRATEGDLRKKILEFAESMEGVDLGLPGAQKKLNKLTEDVKALRAQAWKEVQETANSQMEELAQQEAATTAKMITGNVPVALNLSMPSVGQLNAIAATRPFEGKTLKAWLDKAEVDDAARIAATAKIGIIQGDTPTQVARRVLGGGALPESKAAARKAFRDLESVYLTVTNGVQNESKKMFYEANSDLIQETYFVATLDSRTTIECASNDTKKWPINEGPQPPLHFRCRSLRVPLMDPESLSNRPADPTTEKQLVGEYADKNDLGKVTSRSDLPYGHKTKYDDFARKRKRELVGTVPGKRSYQEWLGDQTPEFQDEVLGPTRAAMFRNGDIQLDKFVARDGDTLTLAQLRREGLDIPDIRGDDVIIKKAIGLPDAEDELKYHLKLVDVAEAAINNATPSQRNALTKYMSSGLTNSKINTALRNRDSLPDDLVKIKNNLASLLYNNEVAIDKLYRGVTNFPFTSKGAYATVGKVFDDAGFMSTSPAARTPLSFGKNPSSPLSDDFQFTLLEFGTKEKPVAGLYASGLRQSQKAKKNLEKAKKAGEWLGGETEVLLPPGRRFKIQGLREEIVNRTIYDPVSKKMVTGDFKVLVYEAEFLD